MSIYQGNQLVAGCITASVPTGSIIPFAGSTAPTGFLLCDGSAVSRTTYSALYDVIGTTYGEGDGNTTFNLPNKSYYSGACKGNGTTVGLTNSGALCGLEGDNTGILRAYTGAYGENTRTFEGPSVGVNVGYFGITADSSKSGIIIEPDTDIKLVIKY